MRIIWLFVDVTFIWEKKKPRRKKVHFDLLNKCNQIILVRDRFICGLRTDQIKQK